MPKFDTLVRTLRTVIAALAVFALVMPEYVDARPRGDGHGGARTSAGHGHSAHRSSQKRPKASGNRSSNRGTNANRNTNRNTNANRNRSNECQQKRQS